MISLEQKTGRKDNNEQKTKTKRTFRRKPKKTTLTTRVRGVSPVVENEKSIFYQSHNTRS